MSLRMASGCWPMIRSSLWHTRLSFFKTQSIGAILNVEEVCPGHFYWPDLDIDLTKEIIENPERFPLLAR